MMNKEIEKSLYKEGIEKIACIDEVGRGCFFGDVLAACVIMKKNSFIEGVKDSKKLSEKKRKELYLKIKKDSVAIGIGTASPKEIDILNIKKATKLAMKRALENLIDNQGNKIVPDFILIDAETVESDIKQMSIIKGDDKVYGIACASIVAKVSRDAICALSSEKYDVYNISRNKGYGTSEHRKAILKYGYSDRHRLSFLKKLIGEKDEKKNGQQKKG